MPDILAHRCGPFRAPENSFEGMAQCFADGAAGLECDVSFTADWKAVIWDAANRQFAGRPRDVRRLFFADAKKLARQDVGWPLLTMDGVWSFLRQYPAIRVYFDLKYYTSHRGGILRRASPVFGLAAIREIVLPATRRRLLNRIGFVTFTGGAEILEVVKLAAPEARTELIVVEPWTRLQDYASFLDFITIGWGKRNHWKLFQKSLRRIMQEARNAGLKVNGGLVSSEEEMRWALAQGFDGIWTDNVLGAKADMALIERQQKNISPASD